MAPSSAIVPVPRGARALALALVAACTAFGAAFCAGAWSSGVRWFVVETPSMATAAPVGSLVVTAPVEGARVGQVVAFRPPGLQQTYTHRVIAVDPAGAIRTKGDLNGAADPWTVPASRIEGHDVAILPALGYVLRGLPPALVGALVVLLATSGVVRRDLRSCLRFAGMHLVVTLVLLWLKPFAAVVVVTARALATGVQVAVVGTGVLPAKLVAQHGGRLLAHVETGRIATFDAAVLESGRNAATVTVDLAPWQMLLLVLLACLPAGLLVAVGLPRSART